MNFKQQQIISALMALTPQDAADLTFTTHVTTLLAEKAALGRKQAGKATVQAAWPYAKADTSKPIAPKTPTPSKATKTLPITGTQYTFKKKSAKITVAEREKLAAQWAPVNLRPFNIVKMHDTRDGHGMRLVQYMDRSAGKVICWRYNKIDYATTNRYPAGSVISITAKNGVVEYYAKTSDQTQHQSSKIVERFNRITPNGPLQAEGLFQ